MYVDVRHEELGGQKSVQMNKKEMILLWLVEWHSFWEGTVNAMLAFPVKTQKCLSHSSDIQGVSFSSTEIRPTSEIVNAMLWVVSDTGAKWTVLQAQVPKDRDLKLECASELSAGLRTHIAGPVLKLLIWVVCGGAHLEFITNFLMMLMLLIWGAHLENQNFRAEERAKWKWQKSTFRKRKIIEFILRKLEKDALAHSFLTLFSQ